MHQSDIGEGVELNENDAVTFDVEAGDRGPKAAKVSLSSEQAATAEEPAEEEAPTEESEAEEEKPVE